MFECHLKVGETAEFAKTITETDLAMFSAITGDFDPIHERVIDLLAASAAQAVPLQQRRTPHITI